VDFVVPKDWSLTYHSRPNSLRPRPQS